jgi:hypothetical protein
MEGSADQALDVRKLTVERLHIVQSNANIQRIQGDTRPIVTSIYYVVDDSDHRASYRQLMGDLFAWNILSDEEKHRVRPRLRDEVRALFACPVPSHAATIEGILMQRFFGSARSGFRRPHKRHANHQGSMQPFGVVVSKVIATPELLEAILSYIPARNLIVATRVSEGSGDIRDWWHHCGGLRNVGGSIREERGQCSHDDGMGRGKFTFPSRMCKYLNTYSVQRQLEPSYERVYGFSSVLAYGDATPRNFCN